MHRDHSGGDERFAVVGVSREDRNAREFQNTLTVLAGVLLVPTLIASLYGANTDLPGRNSWTGFIILISSVLLSGVVTYFAIRAWQSRRSRRAEHERGPAQNE